MKKLLFAIALLLGGFAVAQAQERPKKRPVTEKPKQENAKIKSEPTAEGEANLQKREDEVRKQRAEKRAKMEEAKKNVRERIATDTVRARP